MIQHEVDGPPVRLDLHLVHGEEADVAVLIGLAPAEVQLENHLEGQKRCVSELTVTWGTL